MCVRAVMSPRSIERDRVKAFSEYKIVWLHECVWRFLCLSGMDRVKCVSDNYYYRLLHLMFSPNHTNIALDLFRRRKLWNRLIVPCAVVFCFNELKMISGLRLLLCCRRRHHHRVSDAICTDKYILASRSKYYTDIWYRFVTHQCTKWPICPYT